MQAYTNYKAYYDKQTRASKLKEADYAYVLQPKLNHQGIKIPLTEFRWLGRDIIEKVLPNNNFLARKIGTNKTQVLHRMRMRQFTPRQPPPDIRMTPQAYKPDPDVSLKHNNLYAIAWECEYEQLIFDAENINVTPHTSTEIPVQSDISTEEIRNTPGTAHGCSPDILPQREELCDVTDTYPDLKTDLEMRSEQPISSPTNPRS